MCPVSHRITISVGPRTKRIGARHEGWIHRATCSPWEARSSSIQFTRPSVACEPSDRPYRTMANGIGDGD